jgi:hypothetical protein
VSAEAGDGAGLLFSGGIVRIEYVTTRHSRDVADSIGARLIASGIARKVDGEEVSPRTGKPKRKYKRRDMVAE